MEPGPFKKDRMVIMNIDYSTFKEAKKGDEVRSVTTGKGLVAHVDLDYDYGVWVRFENGHMFSFDTAGFGSDNDERPDLYPGHEPFTVTRTITKEV